MILLSDETMAGKAVGVYKLRSSYLTSNGVTVTEAQSISK